MGNGQVVWDRTINENGDYKKVAFLQGKQNEPIGKGDEVDITLYVPNEQYGKDLKKYFETNKNIIIKSIKTKS